MLLRLHMCVHLMVRVMHWPAWTPPPSGMGSRSPHTQRLLKQLSTAPRRGQLVRRVPRPGMARPAQAPAQAMSCSKMAAAEMQASAARPRVPASGVRMMRTRAMRPAAAGQVCLVLSQSAPRLELNASQCKYRVASISVAM